MYRVLSSYALTVVSCGVSDIIQLVASLSLGDRLVVNKAGLFLSLMANIAYYFPVHSSDYTMIIPSR